MNDLGDEYTNSGDCYTDSLFTGHGYMFNDPDDHDKYSDRYSDPGDGSLIDLKGVGVLTSHYPYPHPSNPCIIYNLLEINI